MSHERFTTSREVYHRIRWDPRLDAREFVIGYDAHLEQLEEMPFEAFVPDGEIPWHRVWYFKRGRQVVWDRKQRIDLLASLTPPVQEPAPIVAAPARAVETPAPAAASPRSDEASVGTPSGFTPLPAWRFDTNANAWVESSTGGPLPSPERLTVLTFNVLFDLYDADLLATERRTPAMLALLRDSGADVIALQEVTPPFLRALLAEPWVREHYWLSEGPGASTVTPYGQVLLSRLPISSLWQRAFSRDKRVIAARLDISGAPLWVATQHLTSNRTPTGSTARAAQVQALIEWTRSLGAGAPEAAPDVVLAGDFNFSDGEPEASAFTEAGFVDAWPALRPTESGETYDPTRNALAALTTRSGRRQRLDRVLVSSPSGRLVPEVVGLLGESPLEGPPAPAGDALYPSDHFGLRCVLRRSSAPMPEVAPVPARPRARTAPLVHHTAVVLIPPDSVWEPIQALRRKHDSKFRRWMPHVTLLYPFLPEEHFDDAEALLAEALRDVKPFEVTLSGFHHFEHRANVTAWLRPEDRPPGALRALHAALEKALPECDEQGRKSARGFTPHLSVGQLPRSGAADIERTLASWGKHWQPLTFEVREVCIIRRKGDTPFEVVRRIPLGGSGGRGNRSVLSAQGAAETPEAARHSRTDAVRQLQSLCARIGTELHPYGSYLLGTDGPDSDVDAVAIGPSHLSREDFARTLIQELPPSSGARFVADAAIPLVKLSLDGVSFDVSYASRPEGVAPCSPEELLALHSEGLDTAGLRSVLGLEDSRVLLDEVMRADAGPERFRRLLRAVKSWARARGIYSHALGYLGGLSWAVMAAWACTRAPREKAGSDVSLLAHFFETFAAWPWPQPVALTPETARYRPDGKRDLLPVIAPALPVRNTARNVSRSTYRVLRDELARAHGLVEQARALGTAESWESLLEPLDVAHEFPARLELTVSAPTDHAYDVASGWVLGHLTALVYRLEGDRRVFVRPLAPTGGSGKLVIGLEAGATGEASGLLRSPGGSLARTVEEFRTSFMEWSHRPMGAVLQVELLHA
ncbi:poly(A) polymerase [Myxococcus sp. RHSTA-1-4]|uniref:poly(A) polymerase n=1 Tax=Myxococcus sp. RHSTA-1-4 TaxID=2874601 RepID=UPI001CC0F242|nr:poly(A) polymerase [Myxococcus sp. RHSTA-1-4]MBZ4422287.1 RNA repair domain-containing protein [Myxococcus sp. RHSTA-1-4]